MPTQMTSKLSPSASMFEKVLRAFETHGIAYSDVLARQRRLLSTGASPKELLAVLRRRESTERMPEYARLEALLVEAMERAARAAEPDAPVPMSAPFSSSEPSSGPAASEGEVAVDLEFEAPGRDLDPRKGLRASELDLSALARHLRSVEERPPARGAHLEALTRSYERAKEGESAAAEHAATLAADLKAAHTSLQAEQGKAREIEQALSESVASRDAAREQVQRDAERYQAELDELRRSLAEREAALEQSRRAIADRDARLANLAKERAALGTVLEERDKAAARLQAALAAAAPAAPAAPTTPVTAATPATAATPVTATTPARASLGAVENKAPVAVLTETPRVERPPPPANPARKAEVSAPSTGRHGITRVLGWGAAALVLAGFSWLFAHRSTPRSTPPAEAAATPAPAAGSSIRDCPACPEMTVLPAGRFKQGAAGGPAYEQPLHWVVIGHPIAMSKHPVTVDDFGRFVAATGRDMQGCDTYDGTWKHRSEDSWQQPGFVQTGTHPVTCVSWNDAKAYAQWLSSETGHRYRLPSASEWEYAARAGAESSQPWGADGQAACANANVADASAARRYPGWSVFPCDDGFTNTSPVDAFKENPFGLGDMLGNVLQWTEDCWTADYAGAPIDGSARVNGDCSLHEVRGASWFSVPSYVRADYRDRFPADYRTSSVGIRLVRDIES